MNSLQRYTGKAVVTGLCLVAANGAFAQISSINSAFMDPSAFNDIPGATRIDVPSYPGSIYMAELNVSKPASGGLNRDIWYFSNNGGASAYAFQNNDYFNASFNLTLTGSGTKSVDLEAGWLFSNPSGSFGGDLQSIVIGGNGAVVQFGGPSYYPFSPAAGGFPGAGGSVPNYTLALTYTMGLNYVVDPNTGRNAFQYSVNGQFAASSPGNTYFDLGAGVGIGDLGPNPLGGYLQIGNDPNNASNNGEAFFSNIKITAAPEPSTLALLTMGMGTLGAMVLRRRRI
jgi:PEP-CTERM motif